MTGATFDDFDNPWKAILEHAFPELLAFFFPAAHERIDWTHPPVFLNTELRQVVRDAELGRRGADALVRVHGWRRALDLSPHRDSEPERSWTG